MSTTVHVLATCLNPAIIDGTRLVFQTIRTGFPDARIMVWGNLLPRVIQENIRFLCASVGAEFVGVNRTAHDYWISKLLDGATEPFWICDTDMVFWGDVSGFPNPESLLCGRYEPAFLEPWSGTHKSERLHTSLLWFNPTPIKNAIREWFVKWHPKGFPFAPNADLIRQCYVPNGKDNPPIFNDTCAGLYNAIGGQAFSDDQNSAFEHLHCGVYSDRISFALPGILGVHKAIFENIAAAKGLNSEQNKFYSVQSTK